MVRVVEASPTGCGGNLKIHQLNKVNLALVIYQTIESENIKGKK